MKIRDIIELVFVFIFVLFLINYLSQHGVFPRVLASLEDFIKILLYQK